MTRARWGLGLAAAALAAGCGSPAPTATLSGALNGSAAMAAVQGNAGLGLPDTWGIVFVSDSPFVYFKITIATAGPALPTGRFNTSSSVAAGLVQHVDTAAQQLGGDYWHVNVLQGQVVGSFALNITSTGPPSPNTDTVTFWDTPHGTFSATLLPDEENGPAAASDVYLAVTF